MSKKKIDSRVKGSTFERAIAKKFQEWTGEQFQRAPGSGAWGTLNNRSDMTGDITCTNPNFKYSIECKKYKDWTLETVISSKANPIWKWFKQCVEQASSCSKVPLLVFAKNRSDVYCMSTQCPVGGKAPIFILNNTRFNEKNTDLYVFLLSDLLNIDPKHAFSFPINYV
jgi:Holliday junction resolvase